MLKMYAFIQDNRVQNIVPCHSQEDADELVNLQYTNNPIAIEFDGYDITIGDKYENGLFFTFNHEREKWDLLEKKENEDIARLKNEINELKQKNKNAPRTFNYDTSLFEEYVDYRIGEAVYKYNEFFKSNFIIFKINNAEYRINLSHENWNGFMDMYNSYKALKENQIDTYLYWFDGEANKIIFENEKDCLNLMKAWRENNERLADRLNDIIKKIYSCKKKSEVKAIEISFE